MYFLYFIALFSVAVSASPFDPRSPSSWKDHKKHALPQVQLEVRQGIPANKTLDCSASSHDGIQGECWEYLKMNDYLDEWWATNSAECEAKQLGFSACYLELAGYITWQCDFIALNTCVPPPSGASAEYKSPQEFYVFWNIYTINLFWTNYHAALMQGQATALGAVPEIVALVSPPVTKNPSQPLFSPIWFVSIGLLAAAAPLLSGTIAPIAFGVAMAPMSGVSGVYGILFPKHDVIEVRWEALAESLSSNVIEYQGNVGKALTEIQTNFTTFRNVTHGGYYAQKFHTNLPDNTDFMYHDMLKWVFNQALALGGWFISRNVGIDPRLIPQDKFLCNELDDKNTCGPLWYDGKDSYGLVRADDLGMDRSKTIFDVATDKNWTTPEELYIDSAACRGRNGSEAFNTDEPDLPCTSNLPICDFNQDYNPYQILLTRNNPAQYTNCPSTQGFGVKTWEDEAGVPFTYLGPFLMSGVKYNEQSS